MTQAQSDDQIGGTGITDGTGTDVKFAIAHDYLTQTGGAERVVLAMARGLNVTDIATSFYDAESTFTEFRDFEVHASMKGITALTRRDPRVVFPAMRTAIKRITVPECDVLLCSSSGWAHAVESDVPKVVYFHSPARWLYADSDYFRGRARYLKHILAPQLAALKKWDFAASKTADHVFANSNVVAARIKSAYGIDAEVLHPPTAIEINGDSHKPEKLADDEPFFITIARARGYKHTDFVIEAAEKSGTKLVVVGQESPTETDSANTVLLGRVTDSELRWLYRNCTGLVAAAHEDFGLTPIEANAYGKPVVALRSGGYLDTTVEGVSGLFFDELTSDAISGAITDCAQQQWNTAEIMKNADRFGVEAFAQKIRNVATALVRG
ncbi:MAG: glycosyltransferase [Gordonia sp. (in: high G+C Gram-positive bacteria)]